MDRQMDTVMPKYRPNAGHNNLMLQSFVSLSIRIGLLVKAGLGACSQ